MSEKKICGGCNAPIEGCKSFSAMGQNWHPEHFICQKCKKMITDDSFAVEQNRPYCNPCYLVLFGKKCKRCGELIEKSKTIAALGVHWHLEHFTCESCKTELNQKQFFEKDGMPYCKDCYEKKFCPTCKGCKKPISDLILSALDSKWHKACFKCAKCKSLIGTSTFGVSPEGMPLCEACLNQKKEPEPSKPKKKESAK
ncbi:transforming growth factor beta-1-induced transcript 1 protein-like [Cimex lectularius]|uniref:LIM zinc-binding domain-containing protein n=1 Tax=Cimex lectularius TaxID=79782 RepID=A0A8I6RB66_CIMLE|nr:transforming growth factor beta-1-induced transcript 1 protein-like [Cimex lectularius]XP_014240615.1 transforming growth factor beta-1-induced transcript 1 protein-like [Cimex lectularius]